MVKKAYEIFTKNLRQISLLIIMIVFPLNAASWFLERWFEKAGSVDAFSAKIIENPAYIPNAEDFQTLKTIMIYLLASVVISVLLTIYTLAIVKIVCTELNPLGGPVTVKKCLGFAFGCLPRYILAALAMSALVFAGSFMFVIPGLVIMVISLPLVYFVAFSDKTGFQAEFLTIKTTFKRPGILLWMLIPALLSQLFQGALQELIGIFEISNVYVSGLISVIVITLANIFLALLDIVTPLAIGVKAGFIQEKEAPENGEN